MISKLVLVVILHCSVTRACGFLLTKRQLTNFDTGVSKKLCGPDRLGLSTFPACCDAVCVRVGPGHQKLDRFEFTVELPPDGKGLLSIFLTAWIDRITESSRLFVK